MGISGILPPEKVMEKSGNLAVFSLENAFFFSSQIQILPSHQSIFLFFNKKKLKLSDSHI